jgi:hypothetical protein
LVIDPRACPRFHFTNQVGFRLIPSKYPPVSLFEDVADQEEFEAVYAVQSLTNPRLREELGETQRVPAAERPFGITGITYAMAAFTHLNPDGSRFGTGDFGVFYAAARRTGAIAETVYHMEKWLGYTAMEPQEIDMRCLKATFNASLVDIRGPAYRDSVLYDPDDYTVSQAFGVAIRKQKLAGLTYDSVRSPGIDCYGLFSPISIASVIQCQHYSYCWDGERIQAVYEKSPVTFNRHF